MRKSILLPLLALLITLSIIPSARATDTRELEPVADSYVNIDHPDTNYGNYSWLSLESHYMMDELSYNKFDLSILPEDAVIEKVTLYLHVGWLSDPEEVIVCNSGTDWSEMEITWNNRPGYEQTPTDIVYVSYGEKWYSWDVTADITTNKAYFWAILFDLPTIHGWPDMDFDSSAEWTKA